MKSADDSGAEQSQCNYTHGFLSIIGTMRKSHKGGRKYLQASKMLVHPRRRCTMEDPVKQDHEEETYAQSQQRRDKKR